MHIIHIVIQLVKFTELYLHFSLDNGGQWETRNKRLQIRNIFKPHIIVSFR